MKRFRYSAAASLVLAACLAICLLAPRARAADVTLIKAGKPVARIYLSGPLAEAAVPAKNKAVPADEAVRAELVKELNDHLQKMSAAALETIVTDDPAAVKAPAVVLGALAVKMGAVPLKTSESKEGFRLLVKDGLVLVGGESEEAALFGVYELLGQLGCDWVMPGEIGRIVPARSTVEVKEQDFSSAPDFLFRSLWYRGYPPPRLPEEGARMAQWLRRQRKGAWVSFAVGAGGHVWDAFINRHKAEFDKDATMLALRRAPDGTLKRMGPQLESTHPRVIALFVQDIKDAYRKNIAAGTWTADTPTAFGVGPADGMGYSISAESMLAGSGRTDPIVGEPDRTDDLILMCNKILAEVHKEYPNAHVGFYSYSTHADYPGRYKPDPKIVIIFAPINFSRFHSVLDPNSKSQAYCRDVVEQWGRLAREQGNVLIYRGYNWNLADNMLPYSKIRIWGEELPFYKKNGVIGLNVEATKAWSINGPSDYVFMKLAWDTSRDWKQVLREYCAKSFGPGGPAMEKYFLRLTETQHAAGQEAGSYHAFHLIFSDQWVRDGQADIGEALKLAQTVEEKTRVQYAGYGLEALRLYLDYHKATLQFDFPAAKARYDAMLEHWDKCYKINSDIVANEVPQYLKRFLSRFLEEGVKYSGAPYRMLVKLPDELSTMFDPNEAGHRMNYFSPAVNDSGFVKTKTYSSTWDAQGLTGIRSGAVWYRARFNLPADVKGQPVGLFIGSVEDEARVWINGRSVGTSGQAFSVPSVFDLTDGVRYDGENLLAVEVVRNSKANEIGLGGIIRPCFLFTGPRLEKKASGTLDLRRILPGGELGANE